MKRLLFFVSAYPLRYRLKLLALLLSEFFRQSDLAKKRIPNFVVESRAILGFIYDNQGSASPSDEGMVVKFIFNSIERSLFMRWKSSDFLVFDQVFMREEYKPLAGHAFINPVIVDAGANIGCTSLYLTSFYPNAILIAIEPDPGNFISLQKNIAMNSLTNTHCYDAALWFEEGEVTMNNEFRDSRNWSVQVGVPGTRKVRAVTLAALLREKGKDGIDLLKIDIEGAENAVFKNDPNLAAILRKTMRIAIEIHDAEGESLVRNALTSSGFDFFSQAETLFAERNISST